MYMYYILVCYSYLMAWHDVHVLVLLDIKTSDALFYAVGIIIHYSG